MSRHSTTPTTATPSHSQTLTQQHTIIYPWKRNNKLLLFDASPSAIAVFGEGLQCGSRVEITVGQWAGTSATIIGVRDGFLWRHDDGEKGAGAFNGRNAEDLATGYGLHVVGRIPMQVQITTIDSADGAEQFAADITNPISSVTKEGQTSKQVDAPLSAPSATEADTSIAAMLNKPKQPFLYCLPLSAANHQPHSKNPFPALLGEYDISQQTCQRFHFLAGQRVLYRTGPARGRTAIILGVYQGRLVRQEDGEWPKAFDAKDPISHSKPYVLSMENQSMEPYPPSAISFAGRRYTTAVSEMKSWGAFHRLRFRLGSGPNAGQYSIVLGLFEEKLYCICDRQQLLCFQTPKDLLAAGPLWVGYFAGPLEPHLRIPMYSFPLKIDMAHSTRVGVKSSEGEPPPETTSVELFDIRFGTSLPFGRHHGQAIKVMTGKRAGDIGRIVGVRNGVQYGVFDMNEGAVPLPFPSAVSVVGGESRPNPSTDIGSVATLSRDITPLLVLETPSARVPRTSQVAFFGERIILDCRAASCSEFGYYPGQRILFRTKKEEDSFDVPAMDGDTISAVLQAAESKPQADWTLGVVLGVYFNELWYLDHWTKLAWPLHGSGLLELTKRYLITVVGWHCDPDASPAVPIADHQDPFLDEAAEKRMQAGDAAEGESVSSHSWRYRTTGGFSEPAIQETPSIVGFRTANGRRCFDCSPEQLHRFEGLLAQGPLKDSDPQVGLRFGTRLRRTERIAPVVHKVQIGSTKADEWKAYSDALWFTVIGVLHDALYVTRDTAPEVAIPLPDSELSMCTAVLPGSEGFVEGPITIPDTQDRKWRTAEDTSNQTKSLLDLAKEARKKRNTRLLDSESVKAKEHLVDEISVREMGHRFLLLPRRQMIDILQWVLDSFGLHLAEHDRPDAGFRKLATIEQYFDAVVSVPELEDWFEREQELFQQREQGMRNQIELQYRDGLSNIGFRMKEARYKVDFKASTLRKDPSMLPTPSHRGTEGRASESPSASIAFHSNQSRTPEQSMDQSSSILEHFHPAQQHRDSDVSTSRTVRWRRSVRSASTYFTEAVFFADHKSHELALHRRSIAASRSNSIADGMGSPWKFGNTSSSNPPPEGSESISPLPKAKPKSLLTTEIHTVDAKRIPNPSFHALVVPTPYWPMKYVLATSRTAFFDISCEACSPFGMHHGEKYLITRGDMSGKTFIIIGVLDKKLWRYVEGEHSEAQPFTDSSGAEIRKRHGLKPVKLFDKTDSAVGRCRWVRSADPFYFHTTSGELVEFDISPEALTPYGVLFGDRYLPRTEDVSLAVPNVPLVVIGVKDDAIWFAQGWDGARPYRNRDFKVALKLTFLYAGAVRTWLQVTEEAVANGDTTTKLCVVFPTQYNLLRCFDTTKRVCAPFGVFPGQVVAHVRGPLSPQQGTIIGIHHGRLWRALAGEKYATPYEGDGAKFQQQHTLNILKWARIPGAGDVDCDNCVSYRNRKKNFRMLCSSGEVYLFDVRPDVVAALFRFSPGDKVVFRKPGKHFGKTALILGVRREALWKLEEGDQYATMFLACRHYRDLETEYKPELVSSGTILKEFVG